MIITLIGYMGSGKSFLGKRLATALNLPFYDLDTLIEEKTNCSIADLFKEKGAIYFRKLEKETLTETLDQKKDLILSLGGGTPCFYDNMKILNQKSTSYYLQNSIATLAKRLEPEKEQRPLIAHLENSQLPEFIAKHLFERRPFYEQAQYTINTDKQSIDVVIDEIKKSVTM